jgi:small GTP-binding protein
MGLQFKFWVHSAAHCS